MSDSLIFHPSLTSIKSEEGGKTGASLTKQTAIIAKKVSLNNSTESHTCRRGNNFILIVTGLIAIFGIYASNIRNLNTSLIFDKDFCRTTATGESSDSATSVFETQPGCNHRKVNSADYRITMTEFENHYGKKDGAPLPILDPLSCEYGWVSFAGSSSNLRESGRLDVGGGSNRERQIAMGVLKAVSMEPRLRLHVRHQIQRSCLAELEGGSLSIYNTDTYSTLHKTLSKLNLTNYVSSEYLPGQAASGAIVNGIRHEDLQETSFQNEEFDLIISTDVFEHIPDPYQAFRETHRLLRPGGAHVFTVPWAGKKNDIIMSKIVDGKVVNGPGLPPEFVPPHYHGDPLRPEGILVYTLFGDEMIGKLCDIGFDVHYAFLYRPEHGILGNGNLIFIAIKK